MIKRISIILIILALSASTVQAKNTGSFRIGCTIPAIPGINAPAHESQTEIDPDMLIEETAIAEKAQEGLEDTITQVEKRSTGNETVLVKTMVAK